MIHRRQSWLYDRAPSLPNDRRAGHAMAARLAFSLGAAALFAACGSGDSNDTDADAAVDGSTWDPPSADAAVDATPVGPDANTLCPSDMAYVPTADVCIDRYEASHAMGNIAMSNPGVYPWANLTWEAAQAGCENAGKRLCTEEEWEAACVGPPPGADYPYGSVYSSNACNGQDHGVGAAVPTSSMTACEGGYDGIFDMSGNVWEWTSTCADTTCRIRGGSFSPVGGDFLSLKCSGASSSPVAATAAYVGFRCCSAPASE